MITSAYLKERLFGMKIVADRHKEYLMRQDADPARIIEFMAKVYEAQLALKKEIGRIEHLEREGGAI